MRNALRGIPAVEVQGFSFDGTLHLTEVRRAHAVQLDLYWYEDGRIGGSFHVGTDLQKVEGFLKQVFDIGRKIAAIKREGCSSRQQGGSKIFTWTDGNLVVELVSTYGMKTHWNMPIVTKVTVGGVEMEDLTDLECEIYTTGLRPLPAP